MTLDNDISLKSWLRALRYNIEYYEDTCESKNNRKCENNRSVKNMSIGSESNDGSGDGIYMNIWDCSNRKKSGKNSAIRFENSLESVSGSSYFEDDKSLNASTEFSTGSYSIEDNGSACSSSQNLDVTIDGAKEIVVGDSLNGELTFSTTTNRPIYQNIPLSSKIICSEAVDRIDTSKSNEYCPQNSSIYQNVPIRSQEVEDIPEIPSTDLDFEEEISSTLQYLENVLDSVDHFSESSDSDLEELQKFEDIFEDDIFTDISTINSEFRARLRRLEQLIEERKFTDSSSSFEEYLSEEQLSSVNRSNIEVEPQNFNQRFAKESRISAFCEEQEPLLPQEIKAIPVPKIPRLFRLGTRFSLPPLRLEKNKEEKRPHSLPSEGDFIEGPIEDITTKSFVHENIQPVYQNVQELVEPEAILRKKDLPLSRRIITEVRPHSLPFSFFGGVCFGNTTKTESLTPSEPVYQNLEEIKDHNTSEDTLNTNNVLLRNKIIALKNRLSYPSAYRDHKIRRPNSLPSKEFGRDFEPNLKEDCEPLETEPVYQNINDLDKFETFEEFLHHKELSSSKKTVEELAPQILNVSFAKESRVSSFFEEGVEELQIFEVPEEKLIFEEEFFFKGLKGDVLFWMAELIAEGFGESEDIMEEKELLKSINQIPKEKFERPHENKFPLDDENVEVRRRSSRAYRISKTTDFDLGRRKPESPTNIKNFDIRGIVKIQLPENKNSIIKMNHEHIAYENETFYRVNEKTKQKDLLRANVVLKSAKYLKSKECKEVELKDISNLTYILYFDSIKYAKQFLENEKVQVYVTDNKIPIKKTLLRFLGKRSSREILEKKGIYKNEPIFGNTLRDIHHKGGMVVPEFIYRVIELIERPENIKSLGLYRTSGNLATIQKIRYDVDNGKLGILNEFSKDPDVLTGSLKLFFRELKEPLIPREVCDKFMDITKLNPKQLSTKDHQKIKSILVKNLHEANLETFVVVMRHLLRVIEFKEHNKMDSYNLAVCWGPSMIFSVINVLTPANMDFSKDIVSQSQEATRLVDFLLGYYEMYPAELNALGKRPESFTEKILTLRRQESKDSMGSSDSLPRSQKKSPSSLSLSVDEITRKTVEIIEQNLSVEGLYTKPGSLDKTNKIMKKLTKKKINELDKYKHDVYEISDALKKYLRDFPENLVSRDIVEKVLNVCDNQQNYLEPNTRRKVTALIEEAPKKDTLIFLLRHLAKVTEHHKVSKNDIIEVWTKVLNYQRKIHQSDEDFAKFLTVTVEVFNDDLPDLVRSSFNNNGGSPNRNDMREMLMKDLKHHQAERDRSSMYENVDEVGEASILDVKTEQTKL